MIRLSKRLSLIAEHIPPGASVIDVGTDHGHLPVWLIQTGRAVHVWASDIHPGPLQRAAALVEETDTGDCIELRVCDGLDSFTGSDGDCVVIAGMGGETMIHILAQAPWTKDGVRLILQPQSKQMELRLWLIENGYAIASEALVEDAGRIYPVMSVYGGEAGSYSPAELLLGKWEQIAQAPLLPALVLKEIAKTQKAAAFDPEAAKRLEELEEWKERLR